MEGAPKDLPLSMSSDTRPGPSPKSGTRVVLLRSLRGWAWRLNAPRGVLGLLYIAQVMVLTLMQRVISRVRVHVKYAWFPGRLWRCMTEARERWKSSRSLVGVWEP